MEVVILRKIPRGFVPKQNAWLKKSYSLSETEKHINTKKKQRGSKGRAQKSCKRLSHLGIHNVSRMRKLPDVGFVHESELKKSAPKEITY